MRKFRIEPVNGEAFEIEGTYQVMDNGVLAVVPDGGSRPPFIMSPNGWVRVDVLGAPSLGDLLHPDE